MNYESLRKEILKYLNCPVWGNNIVLEELSYTTENVDGERIDYVDRAHLRVDGDRFIIIDVIGTELIIRECK